MTSACIQLNDVANRILPNMSAAQMNLVRADLRRIADRVKELELFHMATLANEAEEADMAERQARLDARRVVAVDFPRAGAIPVYAIGDGP
jgi:hypothetical protein